jgi:hypothetical protein
MKKLLALALLMAVQTQASSGVNCNGMTAGPIWQSSNGISQGTPVAPGQTKAHSKQPGQR